MRRGILGALVMAALPVLAGVNAGAEERAEKPAVAKKKVLVELYTSQGCDSCPPANRLLGELAALGYGPDRAVLVAFHVDYFNEPWADPYSDPAYSRRQMAYNAVHGRNDLYFTPMMMIDGRVPMLGSDQRNALAALRRASKDKPAVALDLDTRVQDGVANLAVTVSARSPIVVGRDLLVALAITEGPLTTDVLAGENANKTLIEPAVVRSFTHKPARLDRSEPKTVNFPLSLAPDWVPARCRAAVFVQDRANGTVYQADSLPLGKTVRSR
jgi:hypothetical protein